MALLSDNRLGSRHLPFTEIPVIDVAPLLDGSDPQRVADKLGHACEQVGFLYIRNHGIDALLIERMYELTRQFFSLSDADKAALGIAKSGQTLRGYIPEYGENVDPDNTRDFKEVFDFGLHEEETSPFRGPNPMPASLPEVKTVFEAYHAEMMRLARSLIGGIALSLDLPQDYFLPKMKHPISIQRILHYPPQFGEITQDEIGVGAHTDYGFLTILSQDSTGGLQVQNCEGDWISAPPIEGTFVVNIGDFMETFTSGRYVSTMHRVINTSKTDRYSIPFFMDLDFDAVVEPVPTCIGPQSTIDYPAYVCGEHKYKRFVDSYAHLQNAAAES